MRWFWFVEGGFGANEEELCFVTAEFEEVVGQPCLNGRDVGVGRALGGFGADVDLGVTSVTMEVEAGDDVTKVEEGADEEEGSRDRAPGPPD